jgi:hypothetical protein
MKSSDINMEKRIEAIEARNRRVERDKAWEISWTRRLSIAAMTYVVVSCYLIIINKEQPFINAIVPTVGYLLSTIALRKIRTTWQSKLANEDS